MENGLKEFMNEIDLSVKNIESEFISKIDNINYVQNKCREVLGYDRDILWHMFFEANKLKDTPGFLNDICSVLSGFSNRMSSEFGLIASDSGISREDLYSMYDLYLSNK